MNHPSNLIVMVLSGSTPVAGFNEFIPKNFFVMAAVVFHKEYRYYAVLDEK